MATLHERYARRAQELRTHRAELLVRHAADLAAVDAEIVVVDEAARVTNPLLASVTGAEVDAALTAVRQFPRSANNDGGARTADRSS